MMKKNILFTFIILGLLFFVFSNGDNASYSLLSPEERKELIVKQEIENKLNEKKSDFSIKNEASFIPQAYGDHEFNTVNAFSAVDFNTGEVILEKNINKEVSIASVTKIMTAVVALDLAEKEELFTVSKHAAKIIPTKIGVVAGEKMILEELLNAVLLTSANDAAEVIKEGINKKYGQNIFVESMNKKAKILGLKNSSFENVQGFDGVNHYSTAHDLSVLTHYALSNYPLIAEIVKKDYEFLPQDQNHKQFDLYNWNGLLGVYPGISGVKIGNTSRAGKTTIVVSEREGKRIIVVLLGAPGIIERDLWTAQILDLAFEKAFSFEPVQITKMQLQEKYASWKYW